MGEPHRSMIGFFMRLKLLISLEGEKKQHISFLYGKTTTRRWDWTNGGGWKDGAFLTTPQNLAKTWSSTRILGLPLQWTNGKATFHRPTSFIGHMFGIHTGTGRKLPLCGPFGTRQLWSMSGSRLTSHMLLSLSNKRINQTKKLGLYLF